MKTSEIVEGGTYGNGKAGVRRVVKLYSAGRTDAVSHQWLVYEIVAGRRPCNIEVTIRAFASWAKERLA